jgi:hypothetical protein
VRVGLHNGTSIPDTFRTMVGKALAIGERLGHGRNHVCGLVGRPAWHETNRADAPDPRVNPACALCRQRRGNRAARLPPDCGAPIPDLSGRIVGVVLVFRNIAERRTAARTIRENEERFRTLASALPELVWSSQGNVKSSTSIRSSETLQGGEPINRFKKSYARVDPPRREATLPRALVGIAENRRLFRDAAPLSSRRRWRLSLVLMPRGTRARSQRPHHSMDCHLHRHSRTDGEHGKSAPRQRGVATVECGPGTVGLCNQP